MSLKGQIALVTGASRGIGKGIALQLGQAGATVYVTGRQPAAAKAQADALSLPSLDACANEVLIFYSEKSSSLGDEHEYCS